MIVRIWSTGVDPERVDEYLTFAQHRSLPMFHAHDGFLGVLFAESDERFATITLWRDRASVDALERSPTYRDTVADILAAGFLTGTQTVEVLDVAGGDLTDDAIHAVPRREP
ncbi:MAG TPA: antibiotic biosynthesis monooxygenase [Actinomycetota bacterium]|nr:antibiotic biosynthesis monooxygenase [Actinomycetota bacterium]